MIGNLDICQYHKNYQDLVNSLIKETKEDKINSLVDQLDFFTIQGDENFKKNIQACFEELLKIKPGRKLFKKFLKVNQALSRYSFDRNILIKQDISCLHNPGEISFNFDESSYYNALIGTEKVSAQKPQMVTLAHELIHELHRRQELKRRAKDHEKTGDPFAYRSPNNIEECIFAGMHSVEEQHTIVGIHIPLYASKNKLSQGDALCENTFLMALHLPPRIDHRRESYLFRISYVTDYGFYYDWVKASLEKRQEEIDSYTKQIDKALTQKT